MAAKSKAEAAPAEPNPLEARVWLLEQVLFADPKPYSTASVGWRCSRCNEPLAIGMTCCAESYCPHGAKA